MNSLGEGGQIVAVIIFIGAMIFAWRLFSNWASSLGQPKPSANKDWFWTVKKGETEIPMLRAISIGGILNENNMFPINTLDTAKPKSEMKEWVGTSWSIHDSEAAHFQIRSLLTNGHADIFDPILQWGLTVEESALRELIANAFEGWLPEGDDLMEFADNHAGAMSKLVEHGYIKSRKDLERGAVAYDFGRSVTVTRVCLAAGYLTETAAKQYVIAASKLAHETFDSWRDFGASYMLGRAIWGGVDHESFDAMHQITQKLLSDPNSPWQTYGW